MPDTENFKEIGHWATVEVCVIPLEGTKLVITNEDLSSMSMELETARRLYGALRDFDLSGLLLDA